MDLSEIRILLLGDDNVGRTSLIYSLVSEDVVPSSSNVIGDCPRPTTDDISIPPEVTRSRVPTVIMDYCGRQPMSADEIDDLLLPMECPSPNPLFQSSRSLYSCIRQSHVICLVYAFDSRESRDRLLTVWLPLIDRSATTIPILLVANKCDLIDDEINNINNENREFFRLTMSKYCRIEACIETSTRTMKNISELFYSAQKCVLYPINYLSEQNKLTKRFKQCLKRIFTIADQDNDQLLNDYELTTLQDFCFGKISINEEKTTIEQLKKEIKRKSTNGIQIINQQKGIITTALTYQGFECLFELYLNKGKYETIYTTLERFSYNRKLELCVPNAPEGNYLFSYIYTNEELP
jgi:Ras family protein T1